ncbi:hypothetical protein FA95DRAFT_1497770, partial [Auriscalpium vulgare]
SVHGVLGENLTLEQWPPELRSLMLKLGSIGHHANEMEVEGRRRRCGGRGAGRTSKRVRAMLEAGSGRAEEANGRPRSVEGRAIAFANRVNSLGLNMTRLKEFRDRKDEVFMKVLRSALTISLLCHRSQCTVLEL